MAKYDLTPRIAPNLDRHLVLPLLEFTQERELYPNDQILKAKIELLNNTNMVDYAMDIHKSLYHTEDVPQDMVDRRIEVVARLTSLEEAAAPLVTFLENPSAVQELRADKQYNLQMLNDRYQIGPEQIEALYQYAKFQFECGNYSGAADYLYQYRALCTNAERSLSALWRKLAAEILMQDWEIALEELNRLKEIIDSKNFASSLNQVQSRIRLMHWSLFIFFNHDNWRTQIIDLFNQDKYLNAIQTNAPHLLRYLATAFIVNKKRRPQFKEFIKVIQQEQHAFADPIIEFLACVYVNFDFDGAQNKMKECEDVILNDPFLGKRVEESNYTVVPLKDEFLENARLFIFDMDFSECAPRPPSPPKQQQPPQEAPHSSPKKKPTSSKSKSERVHVSRRHLSKIKSGVEKLTSLAEELKGQIPSIDDIRFMATNLAYLQEAVYDHFMFHDRFQAEIEEIDFHTADNFRNLIQDVNKFQRCVTENVEKFATDNAVEIHGLQQKLKEKDDQIRELQQTITTLKLEKQRQAETLALAHTINDTVTKLEFNISAQVTKDVMVALSSQFALSGAGMKIASSYQGGEELTAEEIAILEKGKMERELRVAEAEKQKAKEIADKLAVDLAAEQAAKEAAEVAVKEAAERELAEKLKNDAKPKSPQGPFGSDDEGETTIGLSDDEENEQTVEEVAQAVAKKELEDKIFQAWDIFLSENPNEDTENFVYCDGAAIIYKDMSTPQENIIEIPQPTAGRQLRDDHFVPHQSYLVPASSSQQIDLQLNPNAYFFDIWSPSQQGLSKKKVDREMNSKNAAFYKKYQQLRSNVWSADKITYLEKVEQRSFRSQPWFKFYVRRGDQSFMISDADFIDVNPNDLLILWELLNRTKSYNNTRQLAQIRIQNFLDMYIYDIFRHDAEIGPILTGDNWLNLSPKLSFPGIEAAELGARKLPELGFVYRAADGKKFLRARQVYKFSSRFLHAILKTITERPKGDEEALRLVADKIRWWLLVREWAITADRTLHPVQE